MRLFVAVNVPTAAAGAIDEATSSVRSALRGVRWVPAGSMHFTLRFLGEVLPHDAEALRASLRRAAAPHAAFTCVICGLGCFPSVRRARVVWLGAEPDGELVALARSVSLACDGLGVPPGGRPFAAHLTLGRVRDSLSTDESRTLAEAISGLVVSVPIVVSGVDLMESRPSVTGSKYRVVETVPLGRG